MSKFSNLYFILLILFQPLLQIFRIKCKKEANDPL